MKGNNENGDSGDNDNNNQSVETNSSTSPPRKKQCLAISSSSSKPDNEGLHGSEPDLVGGTIGATSKDVTAQKQGVGETKKPPFGVVQDHTTEETYSDSDSEFVSEYDCEYDSDFVFVSVSDCDSDCDSDRVIDNRTVLDHTHEDHFFTPYGRLRDNRKIYLIALKKRIQSITECKEYLKKIGCDSESNYLGGSRTSPKWFYARLTNDEVNKLAREGGIRSLTSKFLICEW